MPQVVALTNATGRQSASLARAAAAVGYKVRAHIAIGAKNPLVAEELDDLPNTETIRGSLESDEFRKRFVEGVTLLFVNTTAFDEEVEDGKAFADLAKSSSIKHVVYSSMPDHAAGDTQKKGWEGLPQWKGKWEVENYMRSALGHKVTFVHTGVYHNNFTSLPYPLFCMRDVHIKNDTWPDGQKADYPSEGPTHPKSIGFEWTAPFPKDVTLPWLDCEHDFGPAVLQIFKDGPSKWGGKRVPLAFDFLTPIETCAAFGRALNVPARYVEGPIEIEVPVPEGYETQLRALEHVLGSQKVNRGLAAPYWWKGLFEIERESPDESDEDAMARVARELWPGWRDLEEYAREAFVTEERLNNRTWMDDDSAANVHEGTNGSAHHETSGNAAGVSTPRDEIDDLEFEEARPL